MHNMRYQAPFWQSIDVASYTSTVSFHLLLDCGIVGRIIYSDLRSFLLPHTTIASYVTYLTTKTAIAIAIAT